MTTSTLSSLTTMLRRAGLLGDDEVARIDARCREANVPPVVALRDLGLIPEPQLVRFLHSKLMVPAVHADILEHLEPDTLEAVPPVLAWKYLVVPVSTDEVGNLTLAMADPTDLAAVEAITAFTRSYLIRAVAPLSALSDALQRYYGSGHGRVATGSLVAAPDQANVVAAPSQPPTAAPVLGHPSPSAFDPRAFDASPGDDVHASMHAAGSSSILDRLAEVEDRDGITHSVLDFLAPGFQRVILFVHTQHQLRGHDARGEDLLLEAITQVRIPTSGASLFADTIASGAPYLGPWPVQRPVDRMFAQAMGGIEGDILLLPILLRGRVPLLVFAMGSATAWDPLLLGELAEAAGQALERVIQRLKTHATGTGDS